MRKLFILALCVLVFAGMGMAQTWTQGATSTLTGVDKLGAHQNGGRGCAGCHAPHSGARGNGGSATNGLTLNSIYQLKGDGTQVKDANNNPILVSTYRDDAVMDTQTGNYALWGQDLSPLYTRTIYTGDITKDANNVIDPTKSFGITFAATFGAEEEQVATGVMMCLSCHDGNWAKGAMMQNNVYEQRIGLMPPGYGPSRIPTLLGNDGTAAGNYANDHPIGPNATLAAVGLVNKNAVDLVKDRVLYKSDCPDPHDATATIPCIVPNAANSDYVKFITNYGSFNVTQKISYKDANNVVIVGNDPSWEAGGRVTPVVLPSGAVDARGAYLVCTTCHTPHSMYVFSGNAGNGTAIVGNQVLPSYFFIAAPYNPGAPIDTGKKASSATQFCRQCHFTGAGGSNEGSKIYGVLTSY